MQRASLEVLSGNSRGRRIAVEDEVLIGSRPDADLCLDDDGVSWNHARIAFRKQKLWVKDLDSEEGTTLDGGRLGRRWRPLDGVSELCFGAVRARLVPSAMGGTGAFPAPDFDAETGSQPTLDVVHRKGTVLLVESHASDVFFASSCLNEAGYAVVSAQDGVEGMMACNKTDFDLILCDVGIPDLGGTKFVTYAHEQDLRVPILLTAPATLRGVALEGVRLGAAGFLRKPYSKDKLLGKVRSILSRPAQRGDSELPDAFSQGPSAQVLEDFKIEESLGRGGMGEVFLATQISLNRPVALKFLNKLDDDEALHRRFLAEARAAAALVHPNVVQIYTVGMDKNTRRPFFAMEYVDGESLNDLMAKKPLRFKQIIHIVRSVAQALEKSRKAGLVHRDIKPSNVMISERDEVKVLDFGLAKCYAFDPAITSSGAIVGTPYYLPPEQAEGRDLDSRSDLYSLGVTMFEMLAGELPFQAGSPSGLIFLHSFCEPRSICAYRPGIPRRFEEILAKMLAKKPEDRFQTPLELCEALDALEVRLKSRSLLDNRADGEPVPPVRFSEAQAGKLQGRFLRLKGARRSPAQVPEAPRAPLLVGAGLLFAVVLVVGLLLVLLPGSALDLHVGWSSARGLLPADSVMVGSVGSRWTTEGGVLTAEGEGALRCTLDDDTWLVEGTLFEGGGKRLGVFAEIDGKQDFGFELLRYGQGWLVQLATSADEERRRLPVELAEAGLAFRLGSDGSELALEVAGTELARSLDAPVSAVILEVDADAGAMVCRSLRWRTAADDG